MSNSDLHTREIDVDSYEHPAQPSRPTNRPSLAGGVAALLVMALGAAIFGVISTQRNAKGATGASTANTHVAGTPIVAFTPTSAVSWIQAPKRGPLRVAAL